MSEPLARADVTDLVGLLAGVEEGGHLRPSRREGEGSVVGLELARDGDLALEDEDELGAVHDVPVGVGQAVRAAVDHTGLDQVGAEHSNEALEQVVAAGRGRGGGGLDVRCRGTLQQKHKFDCCYSLLTCNAISSLIPTLQVPHAINQYLMQLVHEYSHSLHSIYVAYAFTNDLWSFYTIIPSSSMTYFHDMPSISSSSNTSLRQYLMLISHLLSYF